MQYMLNRRRRRTSYFSVWKKNVIKICKSEAKKLIEGLEGNEPENVKKNSSAKRNSILEDSIK